MRNNYLTKNNTDCLKGICAIMVVICHVCSRTEIGFSIGLGPIITSLGYLGVSGFMFMSGYGLAISLLSRGGGYLRNFLKDRLLPVYCLIVILTVIYFLLKLTLDTDRPLFSEFVQSFTFGGTVVSFGWYLQCIFLIYLIFYLAACISIKCFPISFVRVLFLLVVVGLTFFVGLCLLLRLESTWYETVLSFLGGIFIAINKSKLDNLWRDKRLVLLSLVLFVGLFSICYVFGNGPFLFGPIKIFIKMISSLAFCFCCLSAMRLVSIETPFTVFLGNYYLEIYIIQGAIYLLLRNRHWYVESQWGFFIISITLVLFGAYLIKPITTFLILKSKNK